VQRASSNEKLLSVKARAICVVREEIAIFDRRSIRAPDQIWQVWRTSSCITFSNEKPLSVNARATVVARRRATANQRSPNLCIQTPGFEEKILL
jgi:hypothetical protein